MMKTIKRLKCILSITLAVFMVVSFLGLSINADAKKKGKSDSYTAGDGIVFGNLDGNRLSWTILNYDETTKIAFIVARKPFDSISIRNYRQAIERNYISTGQKAGYVRWSENYWRGWCNDTFYNTCFTDEERDMIQKTTLTSEAAQKSLMNFSHDTTLDSYYVANQKKNGLFLDVYNTQTTTTDYIFFLSSDEFTEYKDDMKYETGELWPLRTNAYDDPNQGLFVNDSTKLIERKYYYSGDGIRPAMYVKLGEVDETAVTDTDSTDKKTDSKTNTKSNTKTTETANKTETKTESNNADTTSDDSKTTSDDSKTTSNDKATATSTKKTTKTKSYANNGTNIGNINLPEDSSHSLSVGGTAQVAINMEYLNSTDKQYNITYTSSNANVFTVDSAGKITAVGSGTANLSVRMKKSNGKVYNMSCRIDVA
ncbi:MAG: Ig-like domain-containing protein [Pseudobutyrivibrio sp.]|nr:Ig-like domain-containing protein [Pseudobutyrivibrio sp.]